MCTVLFAWRVFENTPVCVAANRDERYDRPYTPPHQWTDPAGIVAPRDGLAGGTWIGFNQQGICVAITNRWVPGDGERSRGLLVRDLLTTENAKQARRMLQAELERNQYAPFHLMIADRMNAWTAINDRNGQHTETQLDPGVHIVVNVGIDGEWFQPVNRPRTGARQAANAESLVDDLDDPDPATPAKWLQTAGQYLGDHDYDVCIHGNEFGTRSSSLLALGERSRYWFAPGPPCETDYELILDL